MIDQDVSFEYRLHTVDSLVHQTCELLFDSQPSTPSWQSLAPSTRIRIFLKTHLFLSVLGSRPHGDGVFSHRKRSFSKTLSRVDLFENAVFMLSCGRVKTELFENADVKASIYDVSEHAHGSLGTTKGHFYCLFSFVEV